MSELENLIMQELRELKVHQQSVKDDRYLSKVEVDYLHFIDLFIKKYSREQILEVLNTLYQKGTITAIRNPQGLLFDIKLK